MKKSYRIVLTLLLTLFNLTLATVIQAQDEKPTDQPVYYMAADAEGIQQVYQHLLDGESEPRQLTHATIDIINFGVAYDGLSVAYLTLDQLWLQPIHTEEAEALAPITATQFLSAPVYSLDGQYIAYTDNGVWLLNLATRETRQILENVPLEEGATNAREFRIYQPKNFLLGDDGKAAKLIVDIGVWEWNTVGVYDLTSGELQEFAVEDHIHTDLLPLTDGRVLLYGNNGVAGEFALHIADSLDDINTYTRVLDFSEVTDATLWADQAVEIAPGVVRVFGVTAIATDPDVDVLYFDYDLTAGKADEAHFITLAEDVSQVFVTGRLSPDGRSLPVYFITEYELSWIPSGVLVLFDLATGEGVALDFSSPVSAFSWQP